MVLLHIFQGGSIFSRGGGPIETHITITITCDFQGGSGPPIPPSGSAHGHCCILAFWHE